MKQLILLLVLITNLCLAQNKEENQSEKIKLLNRFYINRIERLKFIKEKPKQIIIAYSIEGGPEYEEVIQYLPQENELIVYQYLNNKDSIKSYVNKISVSSDSLKNEFLKLWLHDNLINIEPLKPFCGKQTWTPSTSIVVKISDKQKKNYFSVSYTDMECGYENFETYKKLLELSTETLDK
ncbi:hypothetical protein Q0590_35155 [Rhodocytophaga aerolata]|uniref:Uncharacterized protein n=1 Tax=Rhodocytophaga aerolata TaxID=455078 RepID=A0ABT8RHX0_9BACT|nr:hypothetical protein [Rhodocytophaga aerolata]MDO1451564.1 hypothetical protein [Rhodocytophaga aerolata]